MSATQTDRVSRAQRFRVPVSLAFRRVAGRRLHLVLLVVALGLAGGLVGAGSVVSANAFEGAVHQQLAATPPAGRALVLSSYAPAGSVPGEPSFGSALARFRSVTGPLRFATVFDPIAPSDALGVRLVTLTGPHDGVVLAAGHLAAGCTGRVCEAVALSPGYVLGQVVSLPLGGGRRVALRIVGLGSPSPSSLPVSGALVGTALEVPSVVGTVLERLEAGSGRVSYLSRTLLPGAVSGTRLTALARAMSTVRATLDRAVPGLTVTTPAGLLDSLVSAGRIARLRLLLVTAEAAALILAFAAFAAASIRSRVRRVSEQLQTLGAGRGQLVGSLATDALLPGLIAVVIVLGGLFLAAGLLPAGAVDRGAFIGEALPLGTIVAVVIVLVAGTVVLFVSSRHEPAGRRFGTLEVAAVVALGLVVWQSASSGGLSPGQVATGGAGLPVLLLIPGLSLFVAAVVLLRVLPVLFRAAERWSRRSPLSVRLAVLSVARSPGRAAAATTFLAVAVGAALFSLEYQATLTAQARAQARFAVGATARAVAPTADSGALTGLLANGRGAVPVLRLQAATVQNGDVGGLSFQLLGLPARQLGRVEGWRSGFSSASRSQLARELRPQPVSLQGPGLPAGGSMLRLYARSFSSAQRVAVVDLLGAGDAFHTLRLGLIGRSWRQLQVSLPANLQGSRVVGVAFPVISGVSQSPVVTPGAINGNVTSSPDHVQAGGLAVRTPAGWRPVASLQSWTAANSLGFQAVINQVSFAHGPIRHGVDLRLEATSVPLIRPQTRLQHTGGGPSSQPFAYALPALAGPALASQAVGGTVAVNVAGTQVMLDIIGKASLFPTVTTSPTAFAVVDYQTLLAALNVDTPGTASPNEAWFFSHPPRQVPATLTLTRLKTREAALTQAPLAAGTRELLLGAGIASALLAVLALLMFAEETVTRQRQIHAEYVAMGVAPRTLRHSIQLQIPLLCVAGLAGAIIGGLIALRITSALVSVTATSGRPLPPIIAVVNWATVAPVLVLVPALVIAGAGIITNRALRHSAAQGLRA